MKTININQSVKYFSIENLIEKADAVAGIISTTSMGTGTGINTP